MNITREEVQRVLGALDDLIIRSDQRTASAAILMLQSKLAEKCPTCGESEPHTGTCGTSKSDTRAWCNKTHTDHPLRHYDRTCPACQDDGPINWLEAVTVNLVREGVNKHKARELAQHFHSLIQKDDAEPGEWPKCKACGGNLWMCMACCPSPKQTPTTDVVAMVNQQAEDEGLWFEAITAPEAYLQKALRELHRAVESSKQTPMRDDELTR